jgi:hypothetical protein
MCAAQLMWLLPVRFLCCASLRKGTYLDVYEGYMAFPLVLHHFQLNPVFHLTDRPRKLHDCLFSHVNLG